MATVFITFTFRASFHISNMDADFKEKRQRVSSQREKRWSMNSQRLEEIVAELMRPIGDLRRSFDTDLSALLEEYLTEAGLHAMRAAELGAADGAAAVVPNFAELALLLQHSASAYGRKVDYLYQHVLSVSDSLQNTSVEMANGAERGKEGEGGGAGEGEAVAGARRRRRASLAAAGDFQAIELDSAASANREPGAARPPPTLPRAYIELAPRALAEGDVPLTDHAGEPVGLLADFHVGWALRGGLLAEGLAAHRDHQHAPLRPIPLLELQQAIEARAPPPPSPPLACSSPLPPAAPASPAPSAEHMPPPPPPPPHKERKRKRGTVSLADLLSTIKAQFAEGADGLNELAGEFCIPARWRATVVARRSLRVVSLRRSLRAARPPGGGGALAGFECGGAQDCGGFRGWAAAEAEAAAAAAAALGARATATAIAAALRRDDSDDDGFFEQSSLGDSDLCPLTLHSNGARDSNGGSGSAEEWALWQAAVVRRAHEAEAKGGVDVRALAQQVLDALPDAEAHAETAAAPVRPFPAVLRATAQEPTDVSRLFLATLFLANAGSVEIVAAPAPAASAAASACARVPFGVRLVSRDPRLYAPARQPMAPPPAVTAVTGGVTVTSRAAPPAKRARYRAPPR